MPGPACYSRGGEMPTITDCNLVMGHLSAENFLGGQMKLDAAAARTGGRDQDRAPLGMGVEEAAEGIVRIIDVKMEEAIKAISTMRGHDLRDFMLLAFGGAGPVHAGRMARDLGMAGRDRAALSWRLFGDRTDHVRRQARLYPVEDDGDQRPFRR